MKIRRAIIEDSEDIWAWRNNTHTRSMFRSSEFVEWAAHVKWFDLMLRRADGLLLVGVDDSDGKVGMVRFDLRNKNVAEISINLNPKKRGLGLAKPLLEQALKRCADILDVNEFVAEIKIENIASIKTFEGAGFQFFRSDDQMSYFRITAPDH